MFLIWSPEDLTSALMNSGTIEANTMPARMTVTNSSTILKPLVRKCACILIPCLRTAGVYLVDVSAGGLRC